MAHKRLGFMQLTIICGFSLYYAWYLITFFGLFMSSPIGTGFAEMHFGQVIFFGASVIATIGLLASFHKTGSIALGHTKFLFLASLIPGLLLPLVVAIGSVAGYPPLPIFYLACFASGASLAIGFMLWEDLATHGYLNRGVLAHGTIFCAGGVLFLACELFLTLSQASVLAILLLCASTALLAFITPRCDTLEDKPVEPVKQYFRSTWHLDVIVSVINIAFGYAFILLYFKDLHILLVAMGIAIFVDLVFALVIGRGKWVVFAGSARICTAFASCALILLVCPGGITKTIALCTLVVFWFVFRTMNGGSLTDLANHHDFSMLYSSTRGKLPANIGFTLGLALGITAIGANIPDLARLYIPLLLVALFILTALFFLPFDNESKTAGYHTLALVDLHESQADTLNKTCESIAARFKLSPRESEVLTYLVRGRNAKHIAEKLYLSESTVKTHISNIYRKVGVHSQQELLDALDMETA